MRAAVIPTDTPIPTGWRRTTFGPPKGMTQSQVYAHEALVGTIQGGALDGAPAIQILIRLDDGDLDRLAESGHLWLTLLGTALPAWSLVPAATGEGDADA